MGTWEGLEECTFLSRLLQKDAMSSAEVQSATALLQKLSKASFRALWKGELLEKQSTTYCRYLSCSSMTEVTYCCSYVAPSPFGPPLPAVFSRRQCFVCRFTTWPILKFDWSNRNCFARQKDLKGEPFIHQAPSKTPDIKVRHSQSFPCFACQAPQM